MTGSQLSVSLWLQRKYFQGKEEKWLSREALAFVSSAEFLDENLADRPRPKPAHLQRIFLLRPLYSRHSSEVWSHWSEAFPIIWGAQGLTQALFQMFPTSEGYILFLSKTTFLLLPVWPWPSSWEYAQASLLEVSQRHMEESQVIQPRPS